MPAIKRLIKECVCGLLSLLGRPAIILESTPDFSDNTFPVYQQLLEWGYDRKYTMVWACGKRHSPADVPENVRCIYPREKGLYEKLRWLYYMSCARAMVCCNYFLLPVRTGQTAFYLTHGIPMKSVRGYYKVPEEIHYCLSAAPGVAEQIAYQFEVDPQKVFSLGYPRNDIFTQPPQPVKEMLETTCKKVVVWYPTFRQHTNGMKTGSGKALPVIHDAKTACELNDWARELDVLLVLKPHFAQDLTEIKSMELSNIRFITDGFFREHNTTSYGFVAGCDGLITDYSSIYYDYTLRDRPIGLVWEDIAEYRENPGFAVDVDAHGKGGVKIYTLEDFKSFLQEVVTDTDSCGQQRRAIRDLANYAPDGKSTQRVTEFIIEKAKL